MCLSLIRRFGGSLWMSDQIREAQALQKDAKSIASSSNPTTTTNYWYSEEFNHYDMIDSIHSLNLLVLWAQFLKNLGVLNSLYAGGLVMSSIASLTPCQSHRWWCCVLDATFLWQGLRWQWFHRLCYLVCILWVDKLVALSGCVISLGTCSCEGYTYSIISCIHEQPSAVLLEEVVHSMYTPTRCKLLSQTLESFQDMNRTWHVLKTQGFNKLNPLILVPFARPFRRWGRVCFVLPEILWGTRCCRLWSLSFRERLSRWNGMDENLGLVLKEQHLGASKHQLWGGSNGPSIIIPSNPIFVQVIQTPPKQDLRWIRFPLLFWCPKSLHSSPPRKPMKTTEIPGEFLPKCTTTFGKGRGVAWGTWIRALSSVSAAINFFGGQKRLQSFAENSLNFLNHIFGFHCLGRQVPLDFKQILMCLQVVFPWSLPQWHFSGGAAQKKMPRRGDVTPWNLEGIKKSRGWWKV